MKATIEVECKNPDQVIKSVEPDLENNIKFNVKLGKKENDNTTNRTGKILLEIESETITGLQAGINSYLRLIKVANEIIE